MFVPLFLCSFYVSRLSGIPGLATCTGGDEEAEKALIQDQQVISLLWTTKNIYSESFACFPGRERMRRWIRVGNYLSEGKTSGVRAPEAEY